MKILNCLTKMELKYQVSIIAKNISRSTQQIEKCRFGKYVFHLVHEATSLKKKGKERKGDLDGSKTDPV